MITSVESLSEQGVRANEDTLLLDEEHGIFGVFDGASSLVPYRSPDGKTGALEAAEIARDVFIKNPTGDLRETAGLANAAIEARHHTLGIDSSKNINRFSCTAAVLKIADKTAHLLQNADSLIVVEYGDGNVSVPLGYFDQDMEIMKKWRQLADEGKKDIRSLVDEDIKRLRDDANSSFGVLNGDPRAMEMCLTTSLSLAHVASILIMTDGLFIPKQNPEALDDWSEYIKICKTIGVRGLLNIVRDKENDDPDLTVYPRYKKHDDATGIFITFRT